jgi:large subunit ribosomal protein L30|eukprot:COSAG01_NODE_7644_length_3115_cov_22.964854_4_plen_94_part_00
MSRIGYLRIKLRRGTLGRTQRVRDTVTALGFGRKGLLNSEVLQENTSTIRGMINRIKHMVEVEPVLVPADSPGLDITKRVREHCLPASVASRC